MDGESGPIITGTVWAATMDDIDALIVAQFPNQYCMKGITETPEEHAPAFVEN